MLLGWLKSRDVFQPSMNYLLFIPHNDIKRFLIGQPHGLLQRIFLTHVIDRWCDICPQIVHEASRWRLTLSFVLYLRLQARLA